MNDLWFVLFLFGENKHTSVTTGLAGRGSLTFNQEKDYYSNHCQYCYNKGS